MFGILWFVFFLALGITVHPLFYFGCVLVLVANA